MPVEEGQREEPELGAPPSGSVGFLLSQLGYATARRFGELLEPFGLDPRQFAMLRYIDAAEGSSQQSLSGRLQIPPSRMVAHVDDLEERGLVERRPSPGDRRVRALHLTPAGRTVLEQALEVATAHETRTTASLSSDERAVLLGMLQRMSTDLGLSLGVHPGMGGGGAAHRPSASRTVRYAAAGSVRGGRERPPAALVAAGPGSADHPRHRHGEPARQRHRARPASTW